MQLRQAPVPPPSDSTRNKAGEKIKEFDLLTN